MPYTTPADAREPDSGPRRAPKRDSLFVMGTLRFAGEDTTYEVRIRNLSEGGLMADCRRVVEPGTRVAIELRGIGRVEGQVAWCAEQRIGVALDRPINPRLARKPVTGRPASSGLMVGDR